MGNKMSLIKAALAFFPLEPASYEMAAAEGVKVVEFEEQQARRSDPPLSDGWVRVGAEARGELGTCRRKQQGWWRGGCGRAAVEGGWPAGAIGAVRESHRMRLRSFVFLSFVPVIPAPCARETNEEVE
ncbi:uncharacterized protein LOC125540449 [Triticum urartu]|uniref:uncharacterized protein LOC125540449 n=1 Tax=Triticum urartu TaxID=4572 RepID=UPI0020448C15|nr:uncharacterized protein LOC125540449 [Triticum urartu]